MHYSLIGLYTTNILNVYNNLVFFFTSSKNNIQICLIHDHIIDGELQILVRLICENLIDPFSSFWKYTWCLKTSRRMGIGLIYKFYDMRSNPAILPRVDFLYIYICFMEGEDFVLVFLSIGLNETINRQWS